jgi:5-methylcytosine-specific restriction endonuclease McrA
MNAALKRLVWSRAKNACEYCHMPSRFYLSPYQIDHIIAEKHGGLTTSQNLALACYHCNLHKGPNIAGKDPSTRRISRLFHPRKDHWDDHFQWRAGRLVGKTTIGRASIAVLKINDPAYLCVRKALKQSGLFP